MSEASSRPLWQWILLAIAPGLVSDACAGLSVLLYQIDRQSSSDLSELLIYAQLLVPLLAIVYLAVLGSRYVKAGMSSSGSVPLFVLGYGALNMLLWGAGCALQLDNLSLGMH